LPSNLEAPKRYVRSPAVRIAGRDGISRAIYVTASAQRVVILRAFITKT